MTDDPIEPKIVALDDSPAPTTPTAAADAAFTAGYSWKGATLEPYSIMRDRLFERLQALDAPMPSELRTLNPQFVLWDAEKIICLCSMTEEELAPLLPYPLRLLKHTQEWGRKNIGKEVAIEAIQLASRIIADAESTRAVERTSRAGGTREGN